MSHYETRSVAANDERALASTPLRPGLMEEIRAVSSGCTECMACVKGCLFLQRHGTPKAIADVSCPADANRLATAYECSLCGLCEAVCPAGVNPQALFLEMRREAVDRGVGDLPEHAVLRSYERRGVSRRYSLYAMPRNCDTVFFPGCTFAGTRSEAVLTLHRWLERSIPHVGMVLDCCTKPSHDLGRDAYFHRTFGELRQMLVKHGVKTVLVACPNCHQVFRQYGDPLRVRSIYEILAEDPALEPGKLAGTLTVHDPCVMRDCGEVQEAVRTLVRGTGVALQEMRSNRNRTVCCGEGAGVGFMDPELAKAWTRRRLEEANGSRILTYCAGCANQLGRRHPVGHVVDLLLDPQGTMEGRSRVTRPPLTYWKRLRLKRRLKERMADAAVLAERVPRTETEVRRKVWVKPLLLLALLVAVGVVLHGGGIGRYLEREVLRDLIRGYGVLAPLAYLLLYSIAPVLFLPGLPITAIAGVLFGPLWGVLYAIVGATTGASIAFLVARYFARDWVSARLLSPRWRHLDREVERHGWKVVAFTRLVPLFPFNLLNYAFGLTRVRFLDYVLATFLCMLPACIAYVVFSSSLLDLLRGRISGEVLLGVAAVAGISLLPLWIRKRHSRRKPPSPPPASSAV